MIPIRGRNGDGLHPRFRVVALALTGAVLLVIVIAAATRGSAASDPGAATAAREASVASLTSKASQVGALEVGWDAAQDQYVVRIPKGKALPAAAAVAVQGLSTVAMPSAFDRATLDAVRSGLSDLVV